jgi:hypothetical protein
VLTYEVAGQLLIVRASGLSQPSERRAFYERIRADRAVRDRSLLLLDMRLVRVTLTPELVSQRLYGLAEALGVKLGVACGLVVGDTQDEVGAYIFQAVGAELGLRVGIFAEETEARRWLAAYE